MPIVDGYEATRRIRDGGFRGPILALSAHSSDDHLLDCLRMGCNDCLCKPIDWIQLAELIRKYVPGCKAPGPFSFLTSRALPQYRSSYASHSLL